MIDAVLQALLLFMPTCSLLMQCIVHIAGSAVAYHALARVLQGSLPMQCDKSSKSGLASHKLHTNVAAVRNAGALQGNSNDTMSN